MDQSIRLPTIGNPLNSFGTTKKKSLGDVQGIEDLKLSVTDSDSFLQV